MKLKGIC